MAHRSADATAQHDYEYAAATSHHDYEYAAATSQHDYEYAAATSQHDYEYAAADVQAHVYEYGGVGGDATANTEPFAGFGVPTNDLSL